MSDGYGLLFVEGQGKFYLLILEVAMAFVTLSLVVNQPYNYLTCRSYSDFYASCKKFPFNTQVSKNSGKTAHTENWNGILGQ
ncbi:hypothetical protein UABHE_003934 [Candidatus Uabimicrobium helgolandensis]